MILDFHIHLGDILYANGHHKIFKQNQRRLWDWGDLQEHFLWPEWRLINKKMRPLARRLDILTGLNRNRFATLENLNREMARYGINKAVVLPVYPHVTFDHLKMVQEKDKDLIFFTGPDYNDLERTFERLAEDVAAGARGMKLHPILNQIPLDSEETHQVLETFAPHHLPVLFHCGVTYYYYRKSEKRLESPRYGRVPPAQTVIKNFPNINFVVGHAGIGNVDAVISLLSAYKNVWVDISFQPVNRIKELIQVFGPERVLFGSDWPWGGMQVALQTVHKATRPDPKLARRILWENAVELLRL